MKVLTFLAAAALALALAHPGHAAVVTYPSSQTIPASGPLPPGGGVKLQLDAARWEMEDGLLVVTGARSISVHVDTAGLAPLGVELFWGHYVFFGPKAIPDALVPWAGDAKSPEKPNQPIWIRVTVPPGVSPGTYTGSIAL